MIDLQTLPTCPHRGRIGAAKLHCRHPQVTGPHRRSRAVPRSRCVTCQLHGDDQFDPDAATQSAPVAPAPSVTPRHPNCNDALHIVTCHYNPAGYRRILENYWRFRQQFPDDQITTVELSFTGQFAIPDAIHISGGPEHLMWQKERLLNIAIERVTAPVIAWIDADILFCNPYWQDEVVDLLENDRARALQLFERVIDTHPDGRTEEAREGHAYAKTLKASKWRRPGGGWAMRRDDILAQGGLDDAHIIGGSDALMVATWEGDRDAYLLTHMGERWRQSFLARMERVHRVVGGRLGYVRGDVVHLYHGSRQNRNYVGRYRYLTDYDFCPDDDLAIDSNGLWRWASDKPEMHAAVAGYFRERDEDR